MTRQELEKAYGGLVNMKKKCFGHGKKHSHKSSQGKNVEAKKGQGIRLPAKHHRVEKVGRSLVGGWNGSNNHSNNNREKRNDIHIIMNSINKKINRHPIRPLSPFKSTIGGVNRNG